MGAVEARGSLADLDALIGLRLRTGELRSARSRRARAPVTGMHGSRFRGRGVDYQESRAYAPGDDIRNMDWRLTARSGRPFTKLFEEERERPVLLMLDTNPCMRFGTRIRFKSVQAAQLGALLAWHTVEAGDRIGFLAFGSDRSDLRPRGGRPGALRSLRALADSSAPAQSLPEESLSQGLDRARRIARPGTRIVLLTDGASWDARSEGLIARLRQHCDFALCLISDTLERTPPPPGLYRLGDGEHQVELDLGRAAVRENWLAHFSGIHQRVVDVAARCGVPWVDVDAAEDPVTPLRRLLAGVERNLRKVA
ncbi:MAG TPA: DUF58 domain-containing protein [Xanthomonadaceae bacterium]|nr:DUF58 domain-containing protein [Xanthomonadaceae bacterium]